MAEATFSLDLHVLGPPLTFALSQDQTLHRKFEPALRCRIVKHPGGCIHVQRGMSFLLRQKPTSSKRLAIQFSETDPARKSPLGPLLGVLRSGFLSGPQRSSSRE